MASTQMKYTMKKHFNWFVVIIAIVAGTLANYCMSKLLGYNFHLFSTLIMLVIIVPLIHIFGKIRNKG